MGEQLAQNADDSYQPPDEAQVNSEALSYGHGGGAGFPLHAGRTPSGQRLPLHAGRWRPSNRIGAHQGARHTHGG